jgi:tetratricopeptide (TPR) repeat protein
MSISSSAPTLASEIGYALRQILILHPTHPLAEVFSCVSDEGIAERTRLSRHMATWSAQLRHPLSHPHALFFLRKEQTQRLLLQRGVAYALLGAPEQARQDLHTLLQRGGTTRRLEGLACLVLAVLATEQERYPDALPLWKQAQAWLQPQAYDRLAYTWYYAKVLIQLKHLHKAHSALTKILTPAAHDPRLPRQEERAEAYAELFEQRGGVCSLLQYQQETIEDLNAAIELHPTCARFFSIRGLLHTKQQHWQAAYQDLWRALHEMPEDQALADCFFVVMQRLGTQLTIRTPPALHARGGATHA